MGRSLVFNTYGNEKQKQVCRLWQDDKVNDIVYGGSKGSGKSYLGVSLIFGDAFMYPNTYYFIARKKLNDIRKFTIPSIHEVFSHWGITDKEYTFNGQDSYFELNNKSRVYLLDAKPLPSDPLYYRFGSMQMTRGWIEEAGEFEESAKANLAASIGRWNNKTEEWNLVPKLLQTCNPSKNYLYRDYYRKHKEGTLEFYRAFVQALPYDNKKLSPEYLQNLERTLSSSEKQRLLHGNWEYDDDPAALIDYDSILDIFRPKPVNTQNKYITCDVARYGRDKTVVMVWEGFRIVYIKSYARTAVTEVAEIIKELKKRYAVPAKNIVVDEDGVGGGVVDILKCVGFVNNASPIVSRQEDASTIKENYANLKSQCYFKFADAVVNKQTYIGCELTEDEKDLIIEELEQVKQREVGTDGKRAVLSKEDVKDLLGRSPDYSDCMMMRWIFELQKTISISISRNFN